MRTKPLSPLTVAPSHFRPMPIVAKWSLISATAELLLVSVDYLPSVLWCCWLGIRKSKSVWPVKKSDEVLAWLIYVQQGALKMICIWSSWCHCHLIMSCCVKIQIGLTFWCRLTQVVLGKRTLNGCLSVCGLLFTRHKQCVKYFKVTADTCSVWCIVGWCLWSCRKPLWLSGSLVGKGFEKGQSRILWARDCLSHLTKWSMIVTSSTAVRDQSQSADLNGCLSAPRQRWLSRRLW